MTVDPKKIDSTFLSSSTKYSDIEVLCDDAKKYKFRAVCVPPAFVSLASKLLEGTTIKLVSVANYPHGFTTVDTVKKEIDEIIKYGAHEVDFVIPAWQLENPSLWVRLTNLCKDHVKNGIVFKAILETSILTKEQIRLGCEAIIKSGTIQYVKTGTGKLGKTTPENVAFIKSIVNEDVLIKASGGISTIEIAREMLAVGADLIGTSKAPQLLLER